MVEKSPNLIFCLGKNCPDTFMCNEKFLTRELHLPQMDGVCNCGTITCLKCGDVGHEPLNCDMFTEWNEDLQNKLDSLNSDWKKKNTKKCPNCKTDIEKNQGCMHMTCAKCRHHFCWLCLGDWSKHGSETGGYYKCNIYKPSEADTKGEQYKKRLQFYIDRFLEHKRGLEMNDDKIKDHIKLLEKKSGSDYWKLNTEVTPGCLDFYIEALKFSAKCRSFIVYTYPLGFKIIDGDQSYLFAQTQYFLEYALEVLDKFLEKHPMKNLVDRNETGVCLSKEFSDIKAKAIQLQVNLGEQFKNAKKEFSDREFLEEIEHIFQEKQKELLQCKKIFFFIFFL